MLLVYLPDVIQIHLLLCHGHLRGPGHQELSPRSPTCPSIRIPISFMPELLPQPPPAYSQPRMPVGAVTFYQENKSVKGFRAIWEESSGVLHAQRLVGGVEDRSSGWAHSALWQADS